MHTVYKRSFLPFVLFLLVLGSGLFAALSSVLSLRRDEGDNNVVNRKKKKKKGGARGVVVVALSLSLSETYVCVFEMQTHKYSLDYIQYKKGMDAVHQSSLPICTNTIQQPPSFLPSFCLCFGK